MLFWVFLKFCILVNVDTPTYDVPGNEEPEETRRKWLLSKNIFMLTLSKVMKYTYVYIPTIL